MARKRKTSFSGMLLILVLIFCGLSVWHTQKNWQDASSMMPESSQTPETVEVYDITGLNDDGDDTDLFNLEAQIQETSMATGKLASARNAVVKIKSPWAEGYGFFISNRGHILTSKSLVSFTENPKDPAWQEQQKLKMKLEGHNRMIERLEAKLGSSGLSEWQIGRTEEQLEKSREQAEALEEKLDEYDADIEVSAIDGTILDIGYVNESDEYDAALLTVENIRSPHLLPVTSWPTGGFFRDLLNQKEKVYTIGNESGKDTTITQSLIFKLRAEEKCCYTLQHKEVMSFSSNGSPLLNSQGEVLGISNVKNYAGKAIPILTVLDEFQPAIGFGQALY